MTRQTFIFSDCGFSECDEKPYALLTANPTKEYHYIAQTEQQQHAYSPQVSSQDQNVYKLPSSMLREPTAARHSRSDDKVRSGYGSRGVAANANVISNLAMKSLYTLTFVEDTVNRCNPEGRFDCHESDYEETCSHLRTLPEGRLKTGETDTVKVPEVLWRILQLELLGILRNSYNRKNLFARRPHEVVRARSPEAGLELVRLINKRGPSRIEIIMQNYRFSFLGYVDWLAGLYGVLSRDVAQPLLFEWLFCIVFAEPDVVKIELLHYTENEGLCLFGGGSFYSQTSPKLVSVGVNISHDMFIVVHLQTDHWLVLRNTFHHDASKLENRVRIIDGDRTQRLMSSRLTVSWVHGAVFGKSPNVEDYLEAV